MLADYFMSLPSEVKNEIISKNPTLIRTFYKTNNYFNELTKQSLYEDVCEKPPTLQELTFNARSQPIRTVFQSFTDNSYKFKIYINNILTVVDSIKISINNNEIIDIIRENANVVFDEVNAYLDILTFYNVRARRLNCDRIHPGYAKYLTLKKHDIRIEEAKTDLTTNKGFKLKNETIIWYMIAIQNKIVFNITDDGNLNKLKDFDNNFEEIKEDIFRLLDKIREKIIAL